MREWTYAYIFLSEYVSADCDLPYQNKTESKELTKNLKDLFLSKLPKKLGNRILVNVNKKKLKQANCIEDLVDIIVGVTQRWQRSYKIVHEDLKIMMGMEAYDKKYMSTSEMLLKQTKRKSEGKVLAKIQQRQLMAYDSKSDSDSSKSKKNNNNSSSESSSDKTRVIKAIVGDNFRPLFNREKKDDKKMYDSKKKNDAKKTDTPNVCFFKFWTGICTRNNCEFHGPSSKGYAEKYWIHASETLVNHPDKPKDCTLVLQQPKKLNPPVEAKKSGQGFITKEKLQKLLAQLETSSVGESGDSSEESF